jgi:hypothetical protein
VKRTTLAGRILLVSLLEESGHLSKDIRSAAIFSIAFVLLAGGCNHPRSTQEGATAASDGVSQVSQTLVGKQITIRGTFSAGCKAPLCILLDNRQVVYIEPRTSLWREPESYAEMEGKRVAATGTLRFYHSPYIKTLRPVQIRPDHFYLEAETTQLRPLGP